MGRHMDSLATLTKPMATCCTDISFLSLSDWFCWNSFTCYTHNHHLPPSTCHATQTSITPSSLFCDLLHESTELATKYHNTGVAYDRTSFVSFSKASCVAFTSRESFSFGPKIFGKYSGISLPSTRFASVIVSGPPTQKETILKHVAQLASLNKTYNAF
jgi:hypothetical protein